MLLVASTLRVRTPTEATSVGENLVILWLGILARRGNLSNSSALDRVREVSNDVALSEFYPDPEREK